MKSRKKRKEAPQFYSVKTKVCGHFIFHHLLGRPISKKNLWVFAIFTKSHFCDDMTQHKIAKKSKHFDWKKHSICRHRPIFHEILIRSDKNSIRESVHFAKAKCTFLGFTQDVAQECKKKTLILYWFLHYFCAAAVFSWKQWKFEGQLSSVKYNTKWHSLC